MSKHESNLSTTVQAGTPVSTLLSVLFVGLKLTGLITWSWLWVLSPLWMPVAIFIVLLSLMYTVFWVMDLFKWK